MAAQKQSAGIDYFRLIAAFMVVAIHTAPFSVWNKEADFLFTYCLCRIAVPFFLMTTGYFVLAPCIFNRRAKTKKLAKYLAKNAGLYLAATLLYLPVSIYSDNFSADVGAVLKDIFFDGTFYHLWYFPAAIMGCILIFLLAKKSLMPAVFFSGAAYLIGLFGDSYYGAIKGIPALKPVYGAIFTFSDYTRNGIFFAPVFLLLGVLLARPAFCIRPQKSGSSLPICITGAVLSAVCLLFEGFITYNLHLQKHNSMYLFLIPTMYFLFQLLFFIPGRAPSWIRRSTMLIYVIHPAVIIAVRGFAKAMGKTELFVSNTFVHYLLVCGISFVLAVLLQKTAAYSFRLFRLDDMEE